MEFSEFKDQLLIDISKGNKKCIKFIDKNNKLVQEYFSDDHLSIVKGFVDDLYLPIVNMKKFKVIEGVLKHSLMKVVLREFKKSNIFIKVCEDGSNKKAIEWLLSMNIDINIQNEDGKTALMYVVQNHAFESLIDTFLKNKVQDLADKDGNTAIFYACNNAPILKKLLKSNLFDYNHVNNDQENALFYCIKNDRMRAIELLLEKTDIDCNLVNNVGKTIAMLLAENTRFNELKSLVKSRNIDVNYKNKFGESIVSAFIKKYYSYIDQTIGDNGLNQYKFLKTKNFGNTFKTLIDLGCDFNCTLDGDGNTPALFYLMIKDYVSLYYLLNNCENLDLTIKNKYGVNASFLSLFIEKKDFDDFEYDRMKNLKHINFNSVKSQFISYKSFDFDYLDSNNNNLLNYILARHDAYGAKALLKMSSETLFCTNHKKENSIIIATKLGNNDILKKLLEQKECTSKIVNTQDYLGNTALHYAVQLRDQYATILLKHHDADPSIENNDGKKAIENSDDIDDPDITVINTNSIPSSVMESHSEKQKLISSLKQKADSNVNNDLKNYHVDVYKQDYDYLIKNDILAYYRPSPYNIAVQQWVGAALYPTDIDDFVLLQTRKLEL